MRGKDMVQAALAAALAAKRQAQRPLDPKKEAEIWERAEARNIRSERAIAAQRAGVRTPLPVRRRNARKPQCSKMWCKAMSLDAAQDTELSKGARVALQFIRALTEKGEKITRAGLSALLGVSTRQVQRYLSELRETGYIATQLICTATGWVVGQAVQIAAKVLPYFMRPRSATSLLGLALSESRGKPGETFPSPYKHKILINGRSAGT